MSTHDERMQLFARRYSTWRASAARELQERALGCALGGNSYTTRQQADRLGELLGLGPRSTLLEIGAGAGWPGVYLAATTGCRVVLSDLPVEGLEAAGETARDLGVAGRVGIVRSGGQRLPLADGCVDAVSHSDVLC